MSAPGAWIAMLIAVAPAAPRRAAPPAIRAVRAVHLDEAAALYRNGKPLTASDAVVITAAAAALYVPYLATNVGPPLFMYGSGVCREIGVDSSGNVDLLCPPPDPADQPLLWLTPPGFLPQMMTAQKTAAQMKRAISGGRAAPVVASNGTPLRFRHLQDLRAHLHAPGARDGGTP